MGRGLVFDSIGKARRFIAGYVDPRVVIRRGAGYEVVSPQTARLSGCAVLARNFSATNRRAS